MAEVKKKKNKKTTQTSFREFQAWLEGVRDMQGDDWIPSADQWARIQEKIDLVDVNLDFAEEPKPVIINTSPAYLQQTPHLAQPRNLDNNQVVASTVKTTLPKRTVPAPVAVDPAIPVKTPNVDTSNGNYTSPFS